MIFFFLSFFGAFVNFLHRDEEWNRWRSLSVWHFIEIFVFISQILTTNLARNILWIQYRAGHLIVS